MSEYRKGSFRECRDVARRAFGFGKLGSFALGCWVYLETRGENYRDTHLPSTRSLDYPIPSNEEIASELAKHEDVSFYDQTFTDDTVGFEE